MLVELYQQKAIYLIKSTLIGSLLRYQNFHTIHFPTLKSPELQAWDVSGRMGSY